MNPMQDQWAIREGADVYGAEGDKVGKIVAAHPAFIVVEKGFFFPTDYNIPRSAIANMDGDDVYLSVTKDEALNSEWGQMPAEGDYLTTESADTGAYAGTATTTTGAYADPGATGTGTYADTGATTGMTDDTMVEHRTEGTVSHVEDADTVRVPVHEEELIATKHTRQAGEVDITKDVVKEDRVLEVPVTEELVRVTRRTVDRDADTGEMAFEEGTIQVPLQTEEVDLEKRVRVAEEVEIAKEQVQHTEQVSGTVRKERVHVDEQGAVTGADTTDDVRLRESGFEEGTPNR